MFTTSNGYVIFSYYCDDDRARVSTGVKAQKLDMDLLKKSERMLLNRVEDAATKYIESCARTRDKLLKAELEAIVMEALGKTKRSGHGFEADYMKMVEDMRSGEMLQPKNKTRYSKHTCDRFSATLDLLRRFAEEEKKTLTYNLNEEWMNALFTWMSRPCRKERRFRAGKTKIIDWPGYSKNTIAITVRYLQAFLGHMYGKKHNSLFYKHPIFNVQDEETDAEVLDTQEIETIYRLQIDTYALARARDITCFGCWVGLRVEDLANINNYKLKGNKFEFFNQKTGETVLIPAHPMAKEIWEKYNGQMPVIQKTNLTRYIAEICKRAGLTEQCMVAITRGGIKRAEYYPKWQLITPHSLRRSFTTNAVKSGIPDRKVMLFTGHTSESSFRKYIRIKKKENAEELAEHPFFKGQ